MKDISRQIDDINTSSTELLESLESEKMILDAYLYTSRVRCGKKTCQCMISEYRHESLCLSYREGGQSKTKSISDGLRTEITQMTETYKKIKDQKKALQKSLDAVLKAVDIEMNKSIKRGRKCLDQILSKKRK